ncbi:uncharacterized protein LOC141724302 [Apium graveolens]|uniref:uncharacterized protein LOC141724302 n=1 Tax=Apium graveolens TaxID=4045 RepID=UPI003D79A7FD
MADSPTKKAPDLSTFLEENDQEPSGPPTQTEDDDYSKNISLEAFSDPKNGDEVLLPPTCINQEYKLSELFGDGDEEATLSSGTSLSMERSIPDSMTHNADSNVDSHLVSDNSPDINFEGTCWISLGSQWLFTSDDALGTLITKHPIFPLCDIQNMTNFQRITRQLLELISVPEKKATLYQALETLCQPDVLRPRSLRKISEQQLIEIGVASKSKGMIVLDLSEKYAEAGEDKMPILLSDDMLNDLSDQEIFSRLQGIRGLDAYMAFTIMLFAQERMLNYWPNERELRIKYDRFNEQLQSRSSEAVAASNCWEPFKGLAAWIIWTYL